MSRHPERFLKLFNTAEWQECRDRYMQRFWHSVPDEEKGLLRDSGLPKDVREIFVLIHGADSDRLFGLRDKRLGGIPSEVAKVPRGDDILRSWLMRIPIE